MPMQAPKGTDLLDHVVVSLDSGLVSLLKLAQMGLTSGKAVDEVRVLLLLSRSPVCLQLHLLLPCLHHKSTFTVWHAQESLAYIKSSTWYRCTNIVSEGLITQTLHGHQAYV